MSIEIKNLSKKYGKVQALSDINLTIPIGMYGLLGRNGAGKTTLMRILTSLIECSSGEITINNIPINATKKIRNLIGYLPQYFSMYPNLSVFQALDYLGLLSEMEKEKRVQRIHELLTRVNLEEQTNTKIKKLSGGMRQRLGIAQALLHDPQVLIVDEPTAGLDPEERIRFRNLLCELAGDRVVILSTHIVEDIVATCENVAILNRGEIIFNNKVELLAQLAEGKTYEIEIQKNELDEIKDNYVLINMQYIGKKVQCRILSNDLPKLEHKFCNPTVEDGYMQLLRQVEGY